jgi:hypothetical protein
MVRAAIKSRAFVGEELGGGLILGYLEGIEKKWSRGHMMGGLWKIDGVYIHTRWVDPDGRRWTRRW